MTLAHRGGCCSFKKKNFAPASLRREQHGRLNGVGFGSQPAVAKLVLIRGDSLRCVNGMAWTRQPVDQVTWHQLGGFLLIRDSGLTLIRVRRCIHGNREMRSRRFFAEYIS